MVLTKTCKGVCPQPLMPNFSHNLIVQLRIDFTDGLDGGEDAAAHAAKSPEADHGIDATRGEFVDDALDQRFTERRAFVETHLSFAFQRGETGRQIAVTH